MIDKEVTLSPENCNKEASFDSSENNKSPVKQKVRLDEISLNQAFFPKIKRKRREGDKKKRKQATCVQEKEKCLKFCNE